MKIEIIFCPHCRIYTLENKCHKCGETTIKNIPSKFSFEDKGRKYRVEELNKKFLEKINK